MPKNVGLHGRTQIKFAFFGSQNHPQVLIDTLWMFYDCSCFWETRSQKQMLELQISPRL